MKKMKPFAALFLALATLLTLAACGGAALPTGEETGEPASPTATAAETQTAATPEGPRKNLRGAYLIGSAEELALLREHPGAKFVVDGEIDLGGAVWEPIPEFSGEITGLWGGVFNHSISNFVIEAPSDAKAVGFFGVCTGTVTDLTFADFTVKAKGLSGASVGGVAGKSTRAFTDVDAKNVTLDVEGTDLTVGGIAGTSETLFKECFSSGKLTLVSSGKTAVGGMVGAASGGMSENESRVDLAVTASGETLLAGGLAGEYASDAEVKEVDYGGRITVSSTAASSFAAPLFGSAHVKISGSFSSARAFNVTGARSANAYVGDMQSGAALDDCWVRDVSNLDEDTLSAEEYALRKISADYMDAEVTIPWKPLVEMTYSDNCSSGHAQHYFPANTYFGLPYVHQCGSLERMKAYMDEKGVLIDLVPKTGWESWLGNDCADAVYWGWARVSGNVSFLLTNDMYQGNSGTLPVGPYKITSTTSTKQIIRDNGEKVMYESYAACKMADALCFAEPNGHARMVMEAAYVYRNPDGSINPDKSYLLTDEQGATVGKEGKLFTTCLYHGKYTFSQLLSSGFIPLTLPEFAEGKITEPEISWDKEPSAENRYDLTLTANYRINWVRAEVKNAAGEVVMERSIFPSSGSHNVTFGTTRFRTYMREVDKTSGSYVCRYFVGLGNGVELEAAVIPFTV